MEVAGLRGSTHNVYEYIMYMGCAVGRATGMSWEAGEQGYRCSCGGANLAGGSGRSPAVVNGWWVNGFAVSHRGNTSRPFDVKTSDPSGCHRARVF